MKHRIVAFAACLVLLGAGIAWLLARSGARHAKDDVAPAQSRVARIEDAALDASAEVHTDALAAPLEQGTREQLAAPRRELERAHATRSIDVRLRAPATSDPTESLPHAIIFAQDFCPPFPIDVAVTIEPLPLGEVADARPKPSGVASDASGRKIQKQAGDTDDAHTSLARLKLDLGLVREGSDGIGTVLVPERARYANVLWRSIVVDVVPLSPAAPELVLVVDVERARAALPGLQLVVVDKRTHEPVVGARVGPGSLQYTQRAPTVELGCGAQRTNAAGFAWLRDLEPQTAARICVQDPDHLTWSTEVTLVPGRVTNLGTIELLRPVDVGVRVIDADSKSVRHALFFTARVPQFVGRETQVVTRGDDSFERVPLEPGSYVVCTSQSQLSRRHTPDWVTAGRAAERDAGAGAAREGAFGVPPCFVEVRDVEREEFVFELRWMTVCAFEISPGATGSLVVQTADGVEVSRFNFDQSPSRRKNADHESSVKGAPPDALAPPSFRLMLAPGDYVARVSTGAATSERPFTFDGSVTTLKLP